MRNQLTVDSEHFTSALTSKQPGGLGKNLGTNGLKEGKWNKCLTEDYKIFILWSLSKLQLLLFVSAESESLYVLFHNIMISLWNHFHVGVVWV